MSIATPLSTLELRYKRSCAIQHDACADTTTSGNLASGVGQHDTQEDEYNAVAGK